MSLFSRSRFLLSAAALALLAAPPLAAQTTPGRQDRGAAALAELVRGLGVNTRVLVVGAHPDDEDTQLIAWLARGRQVETAYLSLTRGDGGQNLIGNELGEALGAIRTEELLAARRLDGGHQYFTRAFDFGFSKSAEETFRHWPRDSILRDMVTVARAFRPHVIISIWSGTPRDGHGHHQASGILARELFEAAGDSVRFPASATAGLAPWTPMKFYRSARWTGGGETYRFDVGEYSPLRGRSYAEIAAESRSQHKSQAMGMLQPKGTIMDFVRLEAAHLPGLSIGKREQGLFDGMDSTWSRLPAGIVDSIHAAIVAAQRAYDPYAPERMLTELGWLRTLATRALVEVGCASNAADGDGHGVPPACGSAAGMGDLVSSLGTLVERIDRAAALASGVALEATVDRETWADGEPVRATVSVFDRGAEPVGVTGGVVIGDRGVGWATSHAPGTPVASRDSLRRGFTLDSIHAVSEPWWLAKPRRGDVFGVRGSPIMEDARVFGVADLTLSRRDASFAAHVPIVYRYADPIRGEIDRPVAVVPAVTLTVDEPVQYVPAGRAFDRVIHVQLRSASDHARTVTVALQLPEGLVADSATRTIVLPDWAGRLAGDTASRGTGRPQAAPALVRDVEFHVRGTLPAGRHTIAATAESEGRRFTTGYTLVDYEHIRPQRLFRDATITLSAVDVKVPAGLIVAYVPGVGDNVAPMLRQLGVPLTVVEPEKLAGTDLSRFTTVVVGPRAYESSPALVAANPRLFDFARRGGTLVVQYGQFEMANPGMMPYPVTYARPADRVTEEDAPVRVLDPSSPLLAAPNRLGAADWEGWVQERALYMPHTHDPRYTAPLSMNDTGEPANDAAILIAPLGRGTYVYTTLSLFRQLPAGVPGGARLFVNLLAARASSGGKQP